MKITYLGPSDQVDVDGVGTVDRGKSIEAPDDLAGRPPEPRLADAMLELRDAITEHDHERARVLRAEIADLDYGAGLLAQVDTWKPTARKVDTATKKSAAKKSVRKTAAAAKKSAAKKSVSKATAVADPAPSEVAP